MTSPIFRFGNERWLLKLILTIFFVALGIGILILSRYEIGADEGMKTVIRIFGVVFILVGLHRSLHYRIARVDPNRRSVEVGYRWYFYDAMKRMDLDEYSRVRIIRGATKSDTSAFRTLLVLGGRNDQPVVTLWEYPNPLRVRKRAVELAGAIGFPLIEENARNNQRKEIPINGGEHG